MPQVRQHQRSLKFPIANPFGQGRLVTIPISQASLIAFGESIEDSPYLQRKLGINANDARAVEALGGPEYTQGDYDRIVSVAVDEVKKALKNEKAPLDRAPQGSFIQKILTPLGLSDVKQKKRYVENVRVFEKAMKLSVPGAAKQYEERPAQSFSLFNRGDYEIGQLIKGVFINAKSRPRDTYEENLIRKAVQSEPVRRAIEDATRKAYQRTLSNFAQGRT